MVPKSIAVELTCTTAAAPEPNKTAPTTVWVGYTGATVAVRKPGHAQVLHGMFLNSM